MSEDTKPVMDSDFLGMKPDGLFKFGCHVLNRSIVVPGEYRGDSPANSTGIRLITPGGSDQYPAMWVRDMAESCDAGMIDAQSMWQHLCLIARCQNGCKDKHIKNGIIPAWSIPDHINFDSSPVFFPGTYDSGTNAVGESGRYGRLPPIDDHYSFIHLAWHAWQAGIVIDQLFEYINDVSLWDRLLLAFDTPLSDAETGLCTTQESLRAVNYGFYDSVTQTGQLLFSSLLRRRAAKELADIALALGKIDTHGVMQQLVVNIDRHLVPVFLRDDGWLAASTGLSGQADVWGTCLAVYMCALPNEITVQLAHTIIDAVHRGTIIDRASAVRHVPIDLDASSDSAWEVCCEPHHTYQNGGYWHTPTGWLIYAVGLIDPNLSMQLLARYLTHMLEASESEVPWEWHAPDGKGCNPCYLTSVSLPLGTLTGSLQR